SDVLIVGTVIPIDRQTERVEPRRQVERRRLDRVAVPDPDRVPALRQRAQGESRRLADFDLSVATPVPAVIPGCFRVGVDLVVPQDLFLASIDADEEAVRIILADFPLLPPDRRAGARMVEAAPQKPGSGLWEIDRETQEAAFL